MASDTVVIYCGDEAYAFPMLVAARSLRRSASRDNFDILIFAVDFTAERLATLREIAASFRADVAPMSSKEYLIFDPGRFATAERQEHVPPASLSRLVTGRFIPESYKRVLYMDGDTFWVGDGSDLADLEIPPGKIMAVPDGANYWRGDEGRFGHEIDRYLNGLGIGRAAQYYNSGLLYAGRDTWKAFGELALTYFAEHMNACRYHDQSALNGVAHGHMIPLSARWNFMQPMRAWGLDEEIEPRLYHFNGRQKPWRGPLPPWQDFTSRYDAARAESALGPLAPGRASKAECAAETRHYMLWKLKATTLQRGRFNRARAAVRESEARAVF